MGQYPNQLSGSGRFESGADPTTPYWFEPTVAANTSTAGIPDIGLVVCASLLMFGSVTGNMTVFVAIGSSRNLRRRNNVLVLSLAASDLLRAAVCLPMLISIQLSDPEWGSRICIAFNFLRTVLETATLLHVALVSLERGFIISNPLIYERMVSRKRTIICVVLTWTVSLVYGMPQVFWSHSADGVHLLSCYIQAPIEFIVFDLFFRFALPLFCIVVSNCKICYVVNGHIAQMQATVSTSLSQFSGNEYSLNSRCSGQRATGHSLDRRTAKMVRTEVSGRMAASRKQWEDCPESSGFVDNSSGNGQAPAPFARSGLADAEDRRDPEREVLVLSAASYASQLSAEVRRKSVAAARTPEALGLSRSYSLPPLTTRRHSNLRRSSVDLWTQEMHSVSIQRLSPPNKDVTDSNGNVDTEYRFAARPDESAVANRKSSSRRSSTVWTVRDDDLCSGYYSEQPSTSSVSNYPSSLSGRPGSRTSRRLFSNALLQRNKAAKLTLALIATFLLCYLPLEICFLLYTVCETCVDLVAMNFAVVLAASSSLLNPLIYNFYSKEFRKAAKDAFLALVNGK